MRYSAQHIIIIIIIIIRCPTRDPVEQGGVLHLGRQRRDAFPQGRVSRGGVLQLLQRPDQLRRLRPCRDTSFYSTQQRFVCAVWPNVRVSRTCFTGHFINQDRAKMNCRSNLFCLIYQQMQGCQKILYFGFLFAK